VSVKPGQAHPFGLRPPHRPYQSRRDLRIEHRRAGGPEDRSRRIENRRDQSARLGLPQRRRRTSAPSQIASRTPAFQSVQRWESSRTEFRENVPTMSCGRKKRPTAPRGSGVGAPSRVLRAIDSSARPRSWPAFGLRRLRRRWKPALIATQGDLAVPGHDAVTLRRQWAACRAMRDSRGPVDAR
jgi:hypothetical protein